MILRAVGYNVLVNVLRKTGGVNMNRKTLAAAWLSLVMGTTLGLAQEGGENGDKPGKGKEGFKRREMADRMEKRNPAGEVGAAERLMTERMEEGAILERILANPKVVGELGLSEEQVNQLKTASQALQQKQTQLRHEMQQAALEQAKIMTAATLDEEALLKAVETTGAVRTEIAKLRIRQLILVKKTLTPEQMAKAKEMRQRFMERMKERRAEGGEGKKEAKEGAGKGGLPKEFRKKGEERRKNNTVVYEKAGEEVDPQDPNQ
jgi:Spy/CpxP family protein refolding chaperone